MLAEVLHSWQIHPSQTGLRVDARLIITSRDGPVCMSLWPNELCWQVSAFLAGWSIPDRAKRQTKNHHSWASLCACDPVSYAGCSLAFLAGSSIPDRSKGRRQRKNHHLWRSSLYVPGPSELCWLESCILARFTDLSQVWGETPKIDRETVIYSYQCNPFSFLTTFHHLGPWKEYFFG